MMFAILCLASVIVARVLAHAADVPTECELRSPFGDIGTAIRRQTPDSLVCPLETLAPRHKPTTVTSWVQGIEASRHELFNAVTSVTGRLFPGFLHGLLDNTRGSRSAENGHNNSNPDPLVPVYPRMADGDAPYSNTEQQLRSAIFIPNTFTYGEKSPVILVPQTGASGYETYMPALIPVLQDVDWADPVWINVPGNSLDDVQSNAEYIAYALNYIAAITRRNVSTVAVSQGSVNTQWAFKYWPSTRKVTSTNVVISGDYDGTIISNLLAPIGLTRIPATLQQQHCSRFIRTLQANGGGSAYVPTTTIYSGFYDEIVQPQTGRGASGYLDDSRHVGVSNNELQSVCRGYPAGFSYTHMTVLINPLMFALMKDAIIHGEAGSTSRLDLSQVCSTFLTPGLGISDLFNAQALMIKIAMRILLYYPKIAQEPAIKPYAAVPLEERHAKYNMVPRQVG